MNPGVRPPLGVDVHGDIRARQSRAGVRFLARVRWTDPTTHRRIEATKMHSSVESAQAWIDQLRDVARTGIDFGQTLHGYTALIGGRWSRGIDSTSTIEPYSAGLRLRVLPSLGHLPVSMLTAGLIDRAIDRWEADYGRSTVKNTVAALVLVLDEAVRDGLLRRNPAKDRARRRVAGRGPAESKEPANPRDLALPDVATLHRLVAVVVDRGGAQCWGDMVMLLATTALRISEVSGLVVGGR